MNSGKHYVLAAGGTGGHMVPAAALAAELMRRGHKVALVSEEIAPQRPGRVKCEGDEWRAELADASAQAPALTAGSRVRVVRLEGVTVFVVPA